MRFEGENGPQLPQGSMLWWQDKMVRVSKIKRVGHRAFLDRLTSYWPRMTSWHVDIWWHTSMLYGLKTKNFIEKKRWLLLFWLIGTLEV